MILMDKIDTQGLSGPVTGSKDNVYPRDENGEPIYPSYTPEPLPLLEPKLREELKALINEVLDEREYQKKLEGPYDFPES